MTDMDAQNETQENKVEEEAGRDILEVKDLVSCCIQCGTCTGSCPWSGHMDMTPRRMWRLVLLAREDEIFTTQTFSLCSSCYMCTLRCPRGLPLTEAMGYLKRIAAKKGFRPYKTSTRFYESFMESVRRHGKVHETEFMGLYFLSMKNPLLPFRFMPLGIRLYRKKKIHLEIPGTGKQERPLERIFQKVSELEDEK